MFDDKSCLDKEFWEEYNYMSALECEEWEKEQKTGTDNSHSPKLSPIILTEDLMYDDGTCECERF